MHPEVLGMDLGCIGIRWGWGIGNAVGVRGMEIEMQWDGKQEID